MQPLQGPVDADDLPLGPGAAGVVRPLVRAGVAANPDGLHLCAGKLLLAMCRHRLGDPRQARADYAQAVRWVEALRPDGEELRRLRAEAEDLIKP